MSILLAYSFDQLIDDDLDILKLFEVMSSTGHFSIQSGRYGGLALESVGSASAASRNMYKNLNTTAMTFTIGADIQMGAGLSSEGVAARPIISLFDSNDSGQCSLCVTPSGELGLYRGQASTLLGTLTAAIFDTTNASWHHVELTVTVADGAGGSFEIFADGVSVKSVSGVDTKGTAVANVTRLYVGSMIGTGTHASVRFDNLIVQDTINPLGPLYASQLTLQSDSAEDDFTPSTGGDNYAVVDELPFSETDYMSSSGSGDGQRFNLSALPDDPISIEFVQVVWKATKMAGGPRTIKGTVEKAGDVGNGSVQPVYIESEFQFARFPLDPDTSAAWTTAGIAAMTAGVEIA